MPANKEFEQLKQEYILAAEEYLARIKNLSFEDLDDDKAAFILTNLRYRAVESTVQFSSFINKKRMQYLNRKQSSKNS